MSFFPISFSFSFSVNICGTIVPVELKLPAFYVFYTCSLASLNLSASLKTQESTANFHHLKARTCLQISNFSYYNPGLVNSPAN